MPPTFLSRVVRASSARRALKEIAPPQSGKSAALSKFWKGAESHSAYAHKTLLFGRAEAHTEEERRAHTTVCVRNGTGFGS